MEKKIYDPRGNIIKNWSNLFLGASLVSLFLDPLFFYAPRVMIGICVEDDMSLLFVLTTIRSLVDAFYIVQVYVKFRTAYVAPSSHVVGTMELVMDPKKIAYAYLGSEFWLDLLAALPLPQVLVWLIFPDLRRTQYMKMKLTIRLIIIFQYLLRLYLTYSLSSKIIEATGTILEKAWAGAAFNLMLFMLASHVTGSCWYLLSIERQEECWILVCSRNSDRCQHGFPDCNSVVDSRPSASNSFNLTDLLIFCNPDNGLYEFGIFAEALTSGITKANFSLKFLYSFWWGMKQLSSIGQGLQVSRYAGEISFTVVVAVLGLVLFALLIGNMQMYLQSINTRTEEWRIKISDAESWMHHRQLPPELRQSVRRYYHYTWQVTEGFDEEQILEGLAKDLRRDIKHHLYSDLVRKVPLFNEMDDHMLDSICKKLKIVFYIRGSCLHREGTLVNEMLFIIRGQLNSYTTNGGRSGFFDTCCIGPGDFCGEELLTWAMVQNPNELLPTSTRTVKCTTDIEALALTADELTLVATQFRRLHWKQLRPTFRFLSQQWRTWAACFIQASWRSHMKRKTSTKSFLSRRSWSGFLLTRGRRDTSFQMNKRWQSI